MEVQDNDFIQECGNSAAGLSLIEIGLGSLLHSFKVPFSGHFLSLNQASFLTSVLLKNKNKLSRIELLKLPLSISLVTALLKSLAPAGKKLTPMLGISMQGLLYSLGLVILGPNWFGIYLAMCLLSLWAFVQPFAIYYILIGKDLIYMADYYNNKLSSVFSFPSNWLWYLLISIIIFKLLIVSILFAGFKKWGDDFSQDYFKKISTYQLKPKTASTAFRGALKDISQPIFIFSALLISIFYYYSNSDHSIIIWKLLRFFAGGFILFYLIRKVPMERLVKYLKTSKWKTCGEVLELALIKIKANKKNGKV